MTSEPLPTPAEALAWLVHADAYVRFITGPPRLVRVVVRDPLDAEQQIDVLRVVEDEITAEMAFLSAVLDARTQVEPAQARGTFLFTDPGLRGWRPGEQRGW